MSTNLYCAECKAELIQENYTLVCLRCDRKSQTSRMDSICVHVYRNTGERVCPYCGNPTHETDWKFQAELHRKWIASGKATSQGWWSI